MARVATESADATTAGAGRRAPASRTRLLDCLLLLLLLLAPNLIWILLDRRTWDSDQASFALTAMELSHEFWHAPSSWWERMLSIGPKPPMLPWIAQFFLEPGALLGNIDAALLLVTFLASSASLLLLYEALRTWFGRPSALVGCLALASTPLFLSASRTFYVQPLQLTTVCWCLHVMARARQWDATRTALHLVAAGSFGMLTMLSSPAFCLLPGVMIAREILWLRSTRWRLERGHVLLLVATAALFAAGFWLLRNIAAAVSYAGWSYSYYFGGIEGLAFTGKLHNWAQLVGWGFGAWSLVSFAAALLVVSAFASRVSSERSMEAARRWWALLVVLQVAFVILLFATSAHQTYRYVLPLMAYLALLVAWSLYRLDRRWVRWAAAALFLTQLVAGNLYLFGALEKKPGIFVVKPLQRSRSTSFGLVTTISEATRDIDTGTVFLATGLLGLYQHNVRYYALQGPEDLSRHRQYQSIEFLFAGSSQTDELGRETEDVWSRIVETRRSYVVMASDETRRYHLERKSGRGHGWATIIRSTDDICRRVAESERFERVELAGHPDIAIYRSRAAVSTNPGSPPRSQDLRPRSAP